MRGETSESSDVGDGGFKRCGGEVATVVVDAVDADVDVDAV